MNYFICILVDGRWYHDILIVDSRMIEYASSRLRFGDLMEDYGSYCYDARKIACDYLMQEEDGLASDSAFIGICFVCAGVSYPIWRGEYVSLRRYCHG